MATEETPATSADAPEPAEQATEQPDSGNAEAAKYRRRLREAETERDRLSEQVTRLQTAEVQRRITDSLEDPTDLWRDGLQLSDVLDEYGQVDEAALDQAVLQVATDHPGWRKRPEGTEVDVDQGRRSDAHGGASWSALLRREG